MELLASPLDYIKFYPESVKMRHISISGAAVVILQARAVRGENPLGFAFGQAKMDKNFSMAARPSRARLAKVPA
jgi:hypothetical protein